MTNETEKPRRKPGMLCPLWRRDVSEVCHNCDWYSAIPMGRTDDQGKVTDLHPRWGCTATHLLQVFRDWGTILDGVQKATESRGNETCARLDVIAEDIMTVSEVTKEAGRNGGLAIAPMMPQVQRRVGGARLMIEKEKRK